MGVGRLFASVAVGDDSPFVEDAGFAQVFGIIAYGEHYLAGCKAFFHQFQCQLLGHFPDDDPGSGIGVGGAQHLSLGKGMALRGVGPDILHGAGLVSPGMVYEQFCIDAEEPVEQFLVDQGTPGHVPHGVHAVLGKPLGIAMAYAPEVRQGLMRPQGPPVAHLVKLCHPCAVFVGLCVLCHNIHGHLGQVEVGAYAGCGREPRFPGYFCEDVAGQLPGRLFLRGKVGCCFQKDFVNGVDADILGCKVLQVDGIDHSAEFYVSGHARHGHNVVQLQGRIALKFMRKAGGAAKAVPLGLYKACGIDFPGLLHHLKKPGAPWYAKSLEGRGDSQADSLVRAAFVGHHKVGIQRIKTPVQAFDRGVEGLEIYGYTGAFPWHGSLRHFADGWNMRERRMKCGIRQKAAV